MRHRDDHDDDLLDALTGLGAHHEPDVRRMRQRVDELAGGRVVPIGGPRRSRPLLVAAATTGVIAAGGWALLGGGTGGGPTVGVATSAPVASRPAPSATGPAEDPASPIATSEATSTTREPAASEPAPTPSSRTATRRDPGPTRPGQPAAGPYDVDVTAAPGRLVLATPALDDWVAVGVRSDGQLVRAKRPVGGTLVEVTVPQGPLATAPLVTSWTDGLPEQDRTTDTWLELPATSGASVRVGPSARPLTVRLHLGLRGTAAAVTVSSPDGRPGSASARVAGSGALAVDVTVPAADAATTIDVRGTGGLGSAALFVGSVTVTG